MYVEKWSLPSYRAIFYHHRIWMLFPSKVALFLDFIPDVFCIPVPFPFELPACPFVFHLIIPGRT